MKKIIFIFLTILFLSLSASKISFAEELYFNEGGDLVFSMHDKIATSGIKYKTIGWVIKRYDDGLYASGQSFVNIPRSGFIYRMPDPENPEYRYTTFVVDGAMIMERIAQTSSEWKNQLQKYGGYVYLDSIMTVTEYGTDTGEIDDAGNLHGEAYQTYEGIRNAREWADGDKLKAYYNLTVQYPDFPETPLELIFTDSGEENGSYRSAVASAFKIGSFLPQNEKYDVSLGIPSGEDLYLYGVADQFRYCVDWKKITGYADIPVKVTKVYELRWYDSFGVYHTEQQSVDRWYHVRRHYEYIRLEHAEKYDLTKAEISSECFDLCSTGGFLTAGECLSKKYGDSRQHVRINAAPEYYAGISVINSTDYRRPIIPDENFQSSAEAVVSELTVWSDRLEINGEVLLADTESSKSGKSISLSLTIPKQEIRKDKIIIPDEIKNKTDYKSSVKLTYTCDLRSSEITNSNINTVTVHTPVAVKASVTGNKENNENIQPSKSDLVIGDKFVLYSSSRGNHRDIKGYGTKDYEKYTKGRYVKMEFPVICGAKVYSENTWIEADETAVFRIPEYVKEGKYNIKCLTIAKNIPVEYLSFDSLEDICEEGVNLDIRNYCAENTFQVTVIGKLYGFTIENEGERYKIGTSAVFPELVECNNEPLPLYLEKLKSVDNLFVLGLYANGIGDEPEETIELDLSYFVIDKEKDGSLIKKPVDIYKADKDDFTADTLIKMEETIIIPAEQAVKIKEGVYYFSVVLEITDKLIAVEKGKDISDIHIKSDYILYNRALVLNTDIYGTDETGRKLSYENSANEVQGYCNMWKKEGFNVDRFEELRLKCGDVLLIGMNNMMKNTGLVIGTH